MSGNFLKPLDIMDNGNFGLITDKPESPSIRVSSVTINETLNLLLPGDNGTLTATVKYSDNSEITSTDDPSIVGWESSDESILTVDSNGGYIANGNGDATITARSSESPTVFDSLNITVVGSFDEFNFGIFDKAESEGGTLVYDSGYIEKQPWLTVNEYENNLSDLGAVLIAQDGDVVNGGAIIFSSGGERAIVALYKKVTDGYELVVESDVLSANAGETQFHIVDFSTEETLLEPGESYFFCVINSSTDETGAAVVSSVGDLSNKYPLVTDAAAPPALLDSAIDSSSTWSRAAVFKLQRPSNDWHILIASRIVTGDVNGFTSTKGSIRPTNVNGATMVALEANVAGGYIRATINTDAIGEPFALIVIEYESNSYSIPYYSGFRYELHDAAKTQLLFDDLDSHIEIESAIKISAIKSDSYDFDMTIGEHTLTELDNTGFNVNWSMGNCNGVFPESSGSVAMLYASSGTDAGGEPQYKIFFSNESSEQWLGAGSVKITFSFEDMSTLETPALPWLSTKYQIIDPLAQATFDALKSRLGQSVKVHVEIFDAIRVTKENPRDYEPNFILVDGKIKIE
ncbi:Ig-like domain-containing protein [Vibrio parahaemolyticus]|uniref:Ig-like domain-containing protein n=1 Tax=Vibrio parahaemolyticus TaxID=670 RepID=UPI000B519081|nr:Ig-like domain-containing protein [Vibrio parahaemolyticus]EGQ8513571.1 hypothetical protein [Vibrio parahaemolyticus]EGR9043556.1 hypothetical protein [Vibrio parahaemolyticus]EJI1399469.1 Ig-like domain-containing protein [Vibrio parahaemolyticus]OWU05171.1 hypothetical protein BGM04_14610 [Vibrio parahaemolyticus]OXD91778.1 hypothetical protein CE132_16460 [Vibrio parahaemolyticus]